MFAGWQGDIVTLSRCVDTNWYEGSLNGQRGQFPVSYVEQLMDGDLSPMTSPLPLSIEITEILMVTMYSWVSLCGSSGCKLPQQDTSFTFISYFHLTFIHLNHILPISPFNVIFVDISQSATVPQFAILFQWLFPFDKLSIPLSVMDHFKFCIFSNHSKYGFIATKVKKSKVK